MVSRMDRYRVSNNHLSDKDSNRTSKNASLYKEVYGSYQNLDYFPIADNTNEIDMSRLKEIVKESNMGDREREVSKVEAKLSIKREENEKREYDINKILEKAKSEKLTMKDTRKNELSSNYDFLKTLETTQNYLEEMNQIKKEINFEKEIVKHDDEKQYMTRELKFFDKQKEIENKELSPLDIFTELKPDNDNSFVTEPISEEKDSIFFTDNGNNNEMKFYDDIEDESLEKDKLDDINILNEKTKEFLRQTKELKLDLKNDEEAEDEIDNDFYTSSYKFSKKDFIDDDFDDSKNKSGIIKIILLVLAILGLGVLIIYFISKYGIGV